jgi:hypothetical protein
MPQPPSSQDIQKLTQEIHKLTNATTLLVKITVKLNDNMVRIHHANMQKEENE